MARAGLCACTFSWTQLSVSLVCSSVMEAVAAYRSSDEDSVTGEFTPPVGSDAEDEQRGRVSPEGGSGPEGGSDAASDTRPSSELLFTPGQQTGSVSDVGIRRLSHTRHPSMHLTARRRPTKTVEPLSLDGSDKEGTDDSGDESGKDKPRAPAPAPSWFLADPSATRLAIMIVLPTLLVLFRPYYQRHQNLGVAFVGMEGVKIWPLLAAHVATSCAVMLNPARVMRYAPQGSAFSEIVAVILCIVVMFGAIALFFYELSW